ncbi:MAG: aminotransferase class V-fold PLP-dependent enzyme [Oscillospiraceae bacterium]|jgi:selenocysteine lyase/cysteine desulfurase|nr:aminotransferase class V-fold PLP-dependent enzyme [Oscillospiraceae bacterium]
MPLIYLDNAATTLHKPPEVGAAMQRALNTCGGAGRGGHAAAQKAAEVLFDCREAAARLFQMSGPDRVILTCNATHALNMAIKSLAKPGKSVLISGYEHNAVVRPLGSLEAAGVKTVPLPTPLFEPDAVVKRFEEALDDSVCLAVCIHVSNVFGFVLPVERVAELCRARGVPMIVDASQSAGLLPINGDLYPYWCMPGHKSLYGPQGTGLLLVPPGGMLAPLMEGGTGGDSRNPRMPEYLPDRLEAGTHNAPGAAGLAAGIRYLTKNGTDYTAPLTRQTAEELSGIKGVEVYSNPACQTGPVSFRIEGKDSETTATLLSDRGIAVRGGLHCAPLAHNTVGTEATGTARAAFSHANTARDIAALVRAVREIKALA